MRIETDAHSPAWPQGSLGSTDNQTCFLTGIRGSLKAWRSYNGANIDASVGVYRINDRYRVQTDVGDGPGLVADVACVPYVEHRYALGTSSAITQMDHAEELPDRKCFLTSVSAHGHGWDGRLVDFPDSYPQAGLWHTPSGWDFGGLWNGNSDGSISGGATAICVDIPGMLPDPITTTAPANGMRTKTLQVNTDDPWTWVCGMTGISGSFLDAPDVPGAAAFTNTSFNWIAKAANGRSLDSVCVR